MLGTDVGY